MNYNHDFHAGNFADVFKHVILTRILLYLGTKAAAFRYIDTHAGSGFYDLSSEAARKTAEWHGGIGRLAGAEWPPAVQGLLAAYLDIATRFGATTYPGSPAIAQALLRPQDRMICCERHPQAAAALRRTLGKRVKIVEMDGYRALNAFVPPVERRGLALIDPPFESRDEFETAGAALLAAWRKWQTGVFMLWYPVKDQTAVDRFAADLVAGGLKRALRIEVQVAAPQLDGPLSRTGLVIVNPPFVLEAEVRMLLPPLLKHLAAEDTSNSQVAWLAGD